MIFINIVYFGPCSRRTGFDVALIIFQKRYYKGRNSRFEPGMENNLIINGNV